MINKNEKTESISYMELARRVGDMVLCNEITTVDENIYDDIKNGNIDYCIKHETREECEKDNDNCEFECIEIYQTYIINKSGADYLIRNTNEIVLYSDLLNVYVWGITHYGTGWDGVFTDIKTIN